MAERNRPKFTYGDVVRRKSDGRRLMVERIGSDGYHFDDGAYALISDQDCYVLLEAASGYFSVATNTGGAPLNDYLNHGYETRRDFADAIRAIIDRFGGRTGQKVSNRNNFLLMRFDDTPGGTTEEAWLPIYLLTPCPIPEHLKNEEEQEPINQELEKAIGFEGI